MRSAPRILTVADLTDGQSVGLDIWMRAHPAEDVSKHILRQFGGGCDWPHPPIFEGPECQRYDDVHDYGACRCLCWTDWPHHLGPRWEWVNHRRMPGGRDE